MIDYNFHLHSNFSDGYNPPEEYVKEAIKLGFVSIGFSEHSPLPFDNPFSLKEDNLDSYITTIENLRNKFGKRIEIYRALEMDYIPNISDDFYYWKNRCKTDYLIGSVHLVRSNRNEELWFTDGPHYETYDEGLTKLFNGDIKEAVKAYYHQMNDMVETQDFDIVGHFDKIKMHNKDRYFKEDEKWYQDLVDESLSLIKEKNLIVEINTRGIYKKRYLGLFPDGLTLKKVANLKIPIIISSDAHRPDELNLEFDAAVLRLKEFNFTDVMKFERGEWCATGL